MKKISRLIICAVAFSTMVIASATYASNHSQRCANTRHWHGGPVTSTNKAVQMAGQTFPSGIQSQIVGCDGRNNLCTLLTNLATNTTLACYQGLCLTYNGPIVGNHAGRESCAYLFQKKWNVVGYPTNQTQSVIY